METTAAIELPIVLIVDDNRNNLFTLRALLEEHFQVQIIEAQSGSETLMLLFQQMVDLIIMDVQMPEMDGFETAAMIRSRKKCQHIPIVFLTAAYKSEEFQEKGFALGGADYLTKPIDPPLLIGRIRSYLRFIEQEKKYYRELENTVRERTAALAAANQEIVALNQRLQKENLRMGAELEVTRHIQQLILPTREELKNVADLEIAGFMEAATEVGGDYYDVLVHDGGVKIGIGDVTGHGLESGMLMLMTQMGVRTLLDSHFQGNAAAFLNSLNRSLYGNVRRIGTDKNLTLCLLDYRDGKLLLTGQHEEVILARKNGQIERIDTLPLGFNVGLRNSVEEWTQTGEAYLQPGDGIVLYTDGITEARNMAKEFYGLERLCAVIGQVWQQSPQQIQQAVIADVKHHIGGQDILDDITLVVIKRKPGN